MEKFGSSSSSNKGSTPPPNLFGRRVRLRERERERELIFNLVFTLL